MPSVKMRRSTRVFVRKAKDGEGVRVLRSGRRLRVQSGAARIRVSAHGTDGEDLFRLIDDSDEASLASGWQNKVGKGRELDAAVVLGDVEKVTPQFPCVDKRFGVVYSRKRKRFDLKRTNSDYDRKFGLYFSRRQRRRTVDGVGKKEFLYLSVVKSSCGLAGVVSTVLRYMWTAKVGLAELSQSQLVDSVFASCGIHFSRYCPFNKRNGFCKIFGAREFIPMFDINFTSVPLCFVRLHASMWFRSMCLSSLILTNTTDQQDEDGTDPDAIYVSSKIDSFQSSFPGLLCSKVEDSGTLNTPLGVSRSTGHVAPNRNGITTRAYNRNGVTTRPCDRNGVTTRPCDRNGVTTRPCNRIGVTTRACVRNGVTTRACSRNGVSTRACSRNGVATHGCHKRRKRSLRTRRARNPLLFDRGSEYSVLDFGIRKSDVKSTSVLHNHEAQKFVRTNSSTDDMKLLKSSLLALGKDIDTVSCSANLLVVESDRCYRESGACVTLELSSSNDWVLAVRKDGLLRCYHRSEKGNEVKPSSTNRFTYAIVWCVESGWKLEFTERRDWAIFKELFKVCGDRNIVPPSPTKAIPVPGICEVSVCSVSHDASYFRPESFIKMNDDELSRALLKKTANYDMDSEDEEWMNTFNSRLEHAKIGVSVHVTEESFETMIDAFEKAVFYSPDDFTDDIPPANLFLDLARREVVEAVYSYWAKKRKQKGVPLLKVFQLNEPKTSFIAKPVLRKKRSIKQRNCAKTAPSGRGKQLSILRAMTAERNGIEVEEASGDAKSALEFAIMKRRRAQTLMENADLAMYRASMAVRIAEAAQAPDPNQALAHFLD